ncbi:MAG TPA: RcnB family protein [Caulobacteraceae bacterium]|jgi:Ni/Co efflux regulator RcnB
MKRFILAALAATSLLTGGAAANAAPTHPGFGAVPAMNRGPAVTHGPVFRAPAAPVYRGPVGPGPVVRFGGNLGGGFVGVSFQRFGFGAFLPAAFRAPDRFVDYRAHALAPPPANYEWVQNGPDALLVNLASGMVVEVVPNAFA